MVPSFSERKKKIIALICEIPSGQVASYGQVAELAGIQRGARLVVRVLRDPGEVSPEGDTEKKVSPQGDRQKRMLPWWRVLRADGSCAVPGQLERLRQEGIVVDKRVDLQRYRWQGLDFLLFAGQSAQI